jgi:hypothetical protein
MIIEDERDESIHDQGWEFQGELIPRHLRAVTFDKFLHVHKDTSHDQLQKDLIEYQWALTGMEDDME